MSSFVDKYFLSKKPSHNRQLDVLDGIRGLAVLWVVLGHMSTRDLLPFFDMKRSAVYGVYLFFVLSGFLLTLPFLVDRGGSLMGAGTWQKYFMRRVLRIYPAYLAVLLFYLILSQVFGFIPESSDVFYDITAFLHHLALLDGKSVFWTIPVEMKFYMVLPVVIGLTAVLSKKLWGRAALICAFLLPYLVAQYLFSLITDLSSMPSYLPVFLIGCLACIAHLMIEGAGSGKGKLFYNSAGWLAFSLIVATIPSVWRACGFQELDFQKFPALYGLLWACLLFSVLKGKGLLSEALSLKWLRYVGIVSFSVYLWHMPVIYLVRKTSLVKWGAFYQFGFVMIGTLLLASFSYLWIEKPFISGRLSRAIFEILGLDSKAGMSDSRSSGLESTGKTDPLGEEGLRRRGGNRESGAMRIGY